MEKSAIDALWNEHLTNLSTWDVSPVNEGPPGKAIRTRVGQCNLRGHTWMNLQMFDSTFFTKLIVIFHALERNINPGTGAVEISGEKELQWVYHNDVFLWCAEAWIRCSLCLEVEGRLLFVFVMARFCVDATERSWEIEDDSSKRMSKKVHSCSDRMELLNADK